MCQIVTFFCKQFNGRKNFNLMEQGWKFSRKNPLLVSQYDQNQDLVASACPLEREATAKNNLFHLAEDDLEPIDDKAPILNQWFKAQSKSISKEQRTPNNIPKPIRKTMHVRPFADRPLNLQGPLQSLEQSIIPRLKMQLRKLESPSLPSHAHQEKRKTQLIEPKMKRKHQLLLFEEMLNSFRHSIRLKNTPAPRKSAQLPLSHQNRSEGKSRKLLSRGTSSKQLRSQNEQLVIWQQARRNRTLNNLLQ